MMDSIRNAPLSLSINPMTAVKSCLARLSRSLVRPVDGVTLAGFRLLFGAVLVWEIYDAFAFDRISRYYVEPSFFFTYEFFPMISPWPEPWIYLHFLAMGLFALGIMLGLYYRLSTVLFCLSYTYVFLLDKSQYKHHYYLIILLSFLLIFVDAHRVASLDRRRKGFAQEPDGDLVPYWQLFILQAQIIIVYFFAGVAKFDPDWLSLEPMHLWLTLRADYPLVGPFLTTHAAAIFFGYGGLLFDLSIGFLLLWRRTRLPAIAAVLFFHLTNNWLFSIGLLPFLMIASTMLFVDPAWLRALPGLVRWVSFFGQAPDGSIPSDWNGVEVVSRGAGWLKSHRLSRTPFVRLRTRLRYALVPRATQDAASLKLPNNRNAPIPELKRFSRQWVTAFVLIYLTIQLLIPLRHWLYPGPVNWTYEGYRFSWLMKNHSKAAFIAFYVTDPATGQTWQVDARQHLTGRQLAWVSTQPDMMKQFVDYIERELRASGQIEDPIIRVEALAGLNGRPLQLFIDPEVDLSQERYGLFDHATWIMPIQYDVFGHLLAKN